MRALEDNHPIVLFVYFLVVTLPVMFLMNPLLLVLSLTGALLFFLVRNKGKNGRSHLFYLLLFVGLSLINPIFYHNGITVLFVVNDNPITLEAILYGVASSAMMISVLYWFRSFSQLMTSDKLLYLFGSASPKLALILSMALRYIPLFGTQAKKVNQAQKALGLYKEDNAMDSMRGGGRVFSVLVTWALENGIITADSMTARGYGIRRRTFFSLYRFRLSDCALLLLILLLSGITAWGMAASALDFSFYPKVQAASLSPLMLLSYVSYGLLAFLPTFLEIKEAIKWNCLQSKI